MSAVFRSTRQMLAFIVGGSRARGRVRHRVVAHGARHSLRETNTVRTIATPVTRRSSARTAWLVPVLASGLVPLAAYLCTLHPGLPAGDSGELITVAATGGVAHPPGYPLYTMLAGLWLQTFPFGNIAWRLNVFSAVC